MIPLFRVSMSPAVGGPVSRVLQSGYIAQGPQVEQFETELQTWMGRRPVSVNSGTSALTLAMRLVEMAGKPVITTPMTCSATNLPILANGGYPVWADVDPITGLISPESVTSRVKELEERGETPAAIVAVDWGGQPADYDALRAAAPGVPIIADAAHSFGSWYRDRRTGDVADFTCFSFQAIKHLTTGDGGALVVPDQLVKRAKNLRWFGIDREVPMTEFRGEQDVEEWGYKFHMNDVAATIGLENLHYVSGVLTRCRAAAANYDRYLDNGFARTAPNYPHVGSWWMYTTLLRDEETRNAFKKFAPTNGVQVSQVHYRNDRLTAFSTWRRDDLPGVDEFSARMICLPTHWETRTYEVIEAVNKFF